MNLPGALARRTDPDSSYRAARRVTESGGQEKQGECFLRLVRENPGLTASELAELSPFDRYAANRRLPELVKAGYVLRDVIRPCETTGEDEQTWWAVYPEPEQMEMTL